MLWKLLAADIERVEGIGAVGTVFEKVFFGLRLLLHGLVLAEAVASSLYSCGLDGEDEVIVVLAVEVRHKALLPGKTLVDDKVFLIVAHRVAEVHVNDLPSVALELMDNHPVEVLVVHGIVRAEGGGIIVVDDRLVWVWCVIGAEIGDERRDFALEFDVKGFEDVQSIVAWLTAHNPIDVGIVVHANAERLHRVDVRVRATVERAVKCRELVVGVDGVKILLRLLNDAVVAERVEVVEIRRIIFVVLLHGRVEAIVRDANLLTEDRSLESFWREVALHLPDVFLTEKLEVFEGRILLIINRYRTHLVKRLVEPFEVINVSSTKYKCLKIW